MSSFVPLRQLPAQAGYKKGDVLVVFGELFARGYANGIVDEAERAGLTVVHSTVGRRDSEGKLRPLNEDELAQKPKPFINIPLEAGFDLEPCSQDGQSPVDQLKSVKMSDWENAKLDWEKVNDSRKRGVERFRKNVEAYMQQLNPLIPKGANVIFLHPMAGGVPRAKIMMPTLNRIVKGTGDRYLSSEVFWKSELGRLAEANFEEVTANTFEHLMDLSSGIRERVEKEGGSARYLAYGYHGTEVMIRGEYVWQSLSPYIQGWAKLLLEKKAQDAWKKGIKATVFNCPEIVTNSSAIFQGLEVPLYKLVAALKKEGPNAKKTKETLERTAPLLKPEISLDQFMDEADKVLTSEPIRRHCIYEKWPQHSSQEQMETQIAASEKLTEMHKDPKNLISFVLSEEIFRATGYVMYHDSWKPQAPVLWLGHDILAKALATDQTL